jgi:hypothetical protein
MQVYSSHVFNITIRQLIYFILGGLSIRLVLQGTNDTRRGRLEIYRSGYGWYTVCDDYWDLNDAHVVCREMGFRRASAVRSSTYYGRGQGSSRYILDFNPRCSGTEASLRDCLSDQSSFWGRGNCAHWEDVGIDCCC